MSENSDFFEDVHQKLISEYKNNKKPLHVCFRDLVKNIKNIDRFTHLIHPYPAKLLVHIPYFFLKSEVFCGIKSNVYDPFCGSGTVLLESILGNRVAYGSDSNPLARLISQVKTSVYDCDMLRCLCDEIVFNVKSCPECLYPPVINIDYWFDDNIKKDLQCLLESILFLKEKSYRDFFLVCFSVAVRSYSNSDPNISVPVRMKLKKGEEYNSYNKRYRKKMNFLKNVKVIDFYKGVVDDNIDRFSRYEEYMQGGNCLLGKISDDARDSRLVDNSIDLIMTSPPYAGAQKYIRASSLSLGWLGLVKSKELKELNKSNIGREDFSQMQYKEIHKTEIDYADKFISDIYTIDKKRACIVSTYLNEMILAFSEMYRVVKKNGYMILIVGNNTICGKMFCVDKCILEIGKKFGLNDELVLVDEIKSRSLLTKRNGANSVIGHENVMIFKKNM